MFRRRDTAYLADAVRRLGFPEIPRPSSFRPRESSRCKSARSNRCSARAGIDGYKAQRAPNRAGTRLLNCQRGLVQCITIPNDSSTERCLFPYPFWNPRTLSLQAKITPRRSPHAGVRKIAKGGRKKSSWVCLFVHEGAGGGSARCDSASL